MRCGAFVMGTRTGGYREVLEQAERAEELGFHRVVLAERHFHHEPLLCASPLVVAAAVAARTRRIRIGLAGRILSLDHPIHIAEAAASLDVLSGGRLDFGATRAALDEESHRVFEVPAEQSAGRFDEALEVIIKAWTEEVLRHEGSHFPLPELAVFPRPLQQPHPPVFIVSVSEARLVATARSGHSAVIGAIRPLEAVCSACERFWAERASCGLPPDSAELQVNRFVYVADSDEQARDELREPFEQFMSERAPDLRAALEAAYGGRLPPFDRMADDFLVVGAPDTVAARLRQLRDVAGVDSLLATFNFVTVEAAASARSMELFGQEVMPLIAGTEEPASVAGR